ncbi:hypothetical protein SCHPADRAFT_901854 [Schizopora paradoxa]|uniref:Uncharacterized protein n=1 Tax=Schizopora paradoxa TaxID=27342 RepID=A0A0H2SG62_9AGAM|nr:hypothetical protein SCHPADRAFT_901854 [Schizopora paradoxa]
MAQKTLDELFGRENFYAPATNAIADYESNCTLHSIYDRKIKEYALVISMGENVTPSASGSGNIWV